MNSPDERCCGSGVCIINSAGECWCGQVWDGKKMAAPSLIKDLTPAASPEVSSTKPQSD
ncbi:hypothetical protein [Polynucleobacter antarcticus]|uniref:hypothetical protein n=1 Tax=Polynucleobacter antarcticus TaxID=1743162 RepID=UPI00156D6DC4|nr:hypothetical protein [Polynucleobacter antarcticus]